MTWKLLLTLWSLSPTPCFFVFCTHSPPIMDCQENEYWDQWGRCVTCQLCGPGQELSKVSSPSQDNFFRYIFGTILVIERVHDWDSQPHLWLIQFSWPNTESKDYDNNSHGSSRKSTWQDQGQRRVHKITGCFKRMCALQWPRKTCFRAICPLRQGPPTWSSEIGKEENSGGWGGASILKLFRPGLRGGELERV